MTRSPKAVAAACLALLAAVPFACKTSDNSTPSRGSSVDSGDVKLEVMPSMVVEIGQPTVEIEDKTTTIAGSVHRKPGVAQVLAGRIDIEFLDSDGEILDSLPAPLTPSKIPQDAQSPCDFHTEYGYVPPKGSTVRLHFVDSDTAAREDLAGGGFETGKINGGGGSPRWRSNRSADSELINWFNLPTTSTRPSRFCRSASRQSRSEIP